MEIKNTTRWQSDRKQSSFWNHGSDSTPEDCRRSIVSASGFVGDDPLPTFTPSARHPHRYAPTDRNVASTPVHVPAGVDEVIGRLRRD